MARYILLSTENNALADRIAEMVEGVHVEGVFYQPINFCVCPEKQRQNVKNWRKSAKWGIPICVKCRRASRAWADIMPRLEEALGKPEEDLG